ncbi:ribonucleotide-diphosphate reductase subunit beta [Candidatus Gracilibacteria bacterium]|nr:ribonucleotide-diphosphate reductase subunit beta [Candidatus Gracilibacteria bacterium]
MNRHSFLELSPKQSTHAQLINQAFSIKTDDTPLRIITLTASPVFSFAIESLASLESELSSRAPPNLSWSRLGLKIPLQCINVIRLGPTLPKRLCSLGLSRPQSCSENPFITTEALSNSCSLNASIFLRKGFTSLIISCLLSGLWPSKGDSLRVLLLKKKFKTIKSIHLAFGCDLINAIKEENPSVWTPVFQKEITDMIAHSVILESNYALDACPQGMLGINSQQFVEYVEHIADRRLERLGLPQIYGTANPFPWMSQSVDLTKEKNFFETRVTEYKTAGSLDWD